MEVAAAELLGDGTSVSSVRDLRRRLAESTIGFGDGLLRTADVLEKDPGFVAARALLVPSYLFTPVGDEFRKVLYLPGHTVSGAWGPQPAPVMVIGKSPWVKETNDRRLFSPDANVNVLKRNLDLLGLDYRDWYITNVVRFMPPDFEKSLKATWIQECAWFLDQEIRLVKPKHILLLGADAVKAVFGRRASLSKLRGSDNLEYMGARVHVTTHPAAVARDPDQEASFCDDLRGMAAAITGKARVRQSVAYTEILERRHLEDVVQDMLERKETEFAMDCEWGGLYRSDAISGKLRTVQWSPKPREAYCLVINRAGLVPSFDDMDAIPELLNKMLRRPEVAVHGHSFRADLKWLVRLGVDVTEQHLNGVDTITAYHLVDPAAAIGYKLENIGVKYTDMGRYDREKEEWLVANGYSEKKLLQYGYAHVPDAILHPYSMCDVDLVSRLVPLFVKWLKDTPLGSYGAYEMNGIRVETMYDFYRALVHPAFLGINEVETEGILVDKTRLLGLVDLFHERLEGMVTDFRSMIGWPEFNFRSVYQVRELLFGYRDAAAREALRRNMPAKRAAPEGVKTLRLTPIKSTGKPSFDWEKVPDELKAKANPSTDSESLQILAPENKCVSALADLRFIDQICKGFLRKPDEPEADDDDSDDVAAPVNEDVSVEYVADSDIVAAGSVASSGLVGAISDDGRIHTSISQLTETGRHRSCVKDSTPIKTKRGVIPIREVRVGDYVWTHRCRWRRVLNTYVHPAEQMYHVTLSNGEVLTCTALHRVLSCDRTWEGIFDAFSLQKAHEGSGAGKEGRFGLPTYHGHPGSYSGQARCKRRDGESDGGRGDTGGAVQVAEETALQNLEAGREEPVLWQGAGQEGLRGRVWLSDTKSGKREVLRTPRCLRGSLGHSPEGLAELGGHPPYRRRSEKQRAGQPGDNYDSRTQRYSSPVQANAAGLSIEKIEPAGVYPVYDIHVEEDHSYAALGLWHHNSRPNLQNIPKKQEAQLKRCFSPDPVRLRSTKGWDDAPLEELKEAGLLNPRYYTIRSCFTAQPGYVFIEADYRQAELNILAHLAGDSNLINATSDPKRDLHSELAVKGLHLPCSPSEVKKLYKTKRDGTKAVVYGILYGRGESAVVRAMRKEGITDFSVAEAAALKEALFGECPKVYEFIEDCHARVYNPGYVETPFGRRRYFRFTRDEAVRKEQERQSVNHPIQGTVADVLHLALINAYYYRIESGLHYRTILPIHDALMFEVPVEEAQVVHDDVIPLCMHYGTEIPHINFKLAIDREFSYRWGEKTKTLEDAIALSKKAYVAA